MKLRAAAALVLLGMVTLLGLLGLFGSCYSIASLRVTQRVSSGEQSAVLEMWVDAPGPMEPNSDPFGRVVAGVLFYPFDKLFSLINAVHAPFDPDIDIRYGPLGALAGITLPEITLVPFVMQADTGAREVELPSDAFARLVEDARRGEGIATYLELVKPEDRRDRTAVCRKLTLIEVSTQPLKH
ncbi:MAG: hypothetical protein U1F36_00240 [Planctomycetota bacterium]